ncbi:MAG: hypothetical protein U1E73_01090 [Planctomycetota bacterium]
MRIASGVAVSLFVAVSAAQQTVFSVQAPPQQPLAMLRSDSGFVAEGAQAWFLGAMEDAGRMDLYVTDGTRAGTRLVQPPEHSANLNGRVLGRIGGSFLVADWNHTVLTDGSRSGTIEIGGGFSLYDVLGRTHDRLILHTTIGVLALAPSGSYDLLYPSGAEAIGSTDAWLFLRCGADVVMTDGSVRGTRVLLSGVQVACLAHGKLWCIVGSGGLAAALRVFDLSTGQLGPALLNLPLPLVRSMAPTPAGIVFSASLASAARLDLWASDGTTMGTHQVGAAFDNVVSMHAWRDRALLFAHDPSNDVQPWVTDGTPGGTYMLANANPATVIAGVFADTPAGTYFSEWTPHQGARVLFTDGTAAGTRRLGQFAGRISVFSPVGSRLVCCGDWQGGAVLVADAMSGVAEPALPPWRRAGWGSLAVTGSSVFGGLAFQAFGNDGVNSFYGVNYCEGAAGGCVRVAARGQHSPFGNHLLPTLGDRVILASADDAGVCWGWWDAGNHSTGTVARRTTSPRPLAAAVHDDRLYWVDDELVISDGKGIVRTVAFPPGFRPYGARIVVTDTHAFVEDYDVWALEFATARWSWVAAGRLLPEPMGRWGLIQHYTDVVAVDGRANRTLGTSWLPPTVFRWRGAGWATCDGGIVTIDEADQVHHVSLALYPDGGLAELDDFLYFVGGDPAHGRQLWRHDGTQAVRITDLHPDAPSGVLRLAVCGNRLFLAADDGIHGLEPWISDGTAAGTRLLMDLAPGLSSSDPSFVATSGGLAYFVADVPGATSLLAVPLVQFGAASSERIGEGCAGSEGIPRLGVSSPPRLGDARFELELASAPADAPALVALDTDAVVVPILDCRLRCAGGLGMTFVSTSDAGSARWPLPLPLAPQFLGMRFCAQAAVADSALSGRAFALTPAIGCTVGAP